MLDDLLRTPARRALPVLILVLAPVAARAQETPPTQQREHIVRAGDTLWDLARAYLMNPFLWPLIFEANRNVVENPHRIYPAERLIIPPLQPVAAQEPIGEIPAEPMPVQPVPQEPVEEPTVVTTLDLRRPVVPLSEYRATPWLSTTSDRDATGRILRVEDPAADEDRLPTTLHPHQRVHIGSMTGARPVQGDSVVVIRVGRRVGEYGRIVEPLAILRVDSVGAATATAQVVRQFSDAKVGDLVMPLGAAPDIGMGVPQEVDGGLEGNLLEFVVQEPLHGTSDVAFLSLGRAQGLGIGDEFAVYVPARAIDNERAERLPPTVVGTVRVIRVGDRTATVRVLNVSSAALRDGLPVKLVRRMP
ncbi:MAG TPA: LysM peptidoglycan-binding domain-containing protein [Longimicrobiales bacterium]|nr:LysM peptidoglycan-binding domain-containing protein [Longimicrobiales bacterium]